MEPKGCPGVTSDSAGSASACSGCPNQKLCSSGEAQQAAQIEAETVMPLIIDRLIKVKHIILVISGKGGTGKSSVSSMLARSIALDSAVQVGLLDLDICGPSIPRIFGLEGEQVHKSITGWTPVYATDNLAVMSCGFLLDSLDDAIIWRGPKKNTMIKQFLMDVDWGKLDYLIIDTPPGTSDEHISVVQYLKQTNLANLDGAVMVTTPQEVSIMDVRKQIDFCKRVGLRVLGIVENMADFVCPKCTKSSTIFPASSGGTARLAQEFDLDIIGRLPLNPVIGRFCDEGRSVFDEHSADTLGGDKSDSGPIEKVKSSFMSIRDRVISKVAPATSA